MANWLPSNIEEWLKRMERRVGILERRGSGGGSLVGEVRTLIAAAQLPASFLWMEGQTLNRADYPELFGIIGITYGAPSGTTFSLPNTKGRVIVGMDTAQPLFNALGKTGGEISHVLTAAESGLRDHNHFQSHASTSGGNAGLQASLGLAGVTQNYQTTSQSGNFNALNAHNNLQPFIVMRYAIRVI